MAFDEEGKPYQRRSNDPCWIKLAPMASGLGLVVFGWGISVETRIGNIQTIQAERTLKIAGIEAHVSEVAKAAFDPSPKAETRVEMSSMKDEHEKMDTRLDRLEERFNNFHQFLLQTRQLIVPPSKRGSLPFTPEEKG